MKFKCLLVLKKAEFIISGPGFNPRCCFVMATSAIYLIAVVPVTGLLVYFWWKTKITISRDFSVTYLYTCEMVYPFIGNMC